MFLELISTAIFSARKIQVKKITFLPFWAVFAQNLGNFGKIFQKKFAPIFFSSFRTTGENFSQNGDPHVTRGPLMVHSLVHPLLSVNYEEGCSVERNNRIWALNINGINRVSRSLAFQTVDQRSSR